MLSNVDLAYYFNSILTKGRKDNTYKFALARFLIEYSYKQNESNIEAKANDNEMTSIKYSVIARSFLKYYWHQICKYKIRQNYNLDKLPLIVQIIHRIFEKEYIPDSFDSMNREKIEKFSYQLLSGFELAVDLVDEPYRTVKDCLLHLFCHLDML
jgi:hypothetical protein